MRISLLYSGLKNLSRRENYPFVVTLFANSGPDVSALIDVKFDQLRRACSLSSNQETFVEKISVDCKWTKWKGQVITLDSAEKPLRSSFESLRTNAGVVEIISDFPFY